LINCFFVVVQGVEDLFMAMLNLFDVGCCCGCAVYDKG